MRRSHLIISLFAALSLLPSILSKDVYISMIYDQTEEIDRNSADAAELAVGRIKHDDYNFKLNRIPTKNRVEANDAIADTLEKFKGELHLGFIGPPWSKYSVITSVTASTLEVPIISHGSTNIDLSDKGIYPYFFRTIPADDRQIVAIADFCEYFDFKEVIVLAATEPYALGLARGFAELVEDNSYDITILASIFFTPGTTDLETQFDLIKKTNGRVILSFMLTSDFKNVLKYAADNEMTGFPYIYFGADGINDQSFYLDEDGSENKELKKAVEGVILTTPNQGKSTRKFKKDLGNFLGPYSLFAYDAVLTYVEAFAEYVDKYGDDKIDGGKMRKILQDVEFSGATGKVSFDKNQDRELGIYTLMNFINKSKNNVLKKVGEWTEKGVESVSNILWPNGKEPEPEPHPPIDIYNCDSGERYTDYRGITELDDLDGDPKLIDQELYCDQVVDCNNWSDEGWGCSPSLAIAYLIIGIITTILLATVFIGGVFIAVAGITTRWHNSVANFGRAFSATQTLGTMIGLLAVFSFFGKDITPVCYLRIWLLDIASGLVISSLFVKVYRVWFVLERADDAAGVMTDIRAILLTLALLIPNIIVMIIWSAADGYKAKHIDDHMRCDSKLFWLWFALLAFYKLIIMVGAAFFAFRTRKHKNQANARWIAFAIYQACIQSLIMIPVIIGTAEQIDFLTWLLVVLFIISVFFMTWALLHVPKIINLIREQPRDH